MADSLKTNVIRHFPFVQLNVRIHLQKSNASEKVNGSINDNQVIAFIFQIFPANRRNDNIRVAKHAKQSQYYGNNTPGHWVDSEIIEWQ